MTHDSYEESPTEVHHGHNRRRYLRVEMPLLVEYSINGGERSVAYTKDVSGKGIFLRTGQSAQKGELIWIRLISRDLSDLIEAEGQIVRVTADGIAVDLFSLSLSETERMDKMVQKVASEKEAAVFSMT